MKKLIFLFLIINSYLTYSQVDVGFIEQLSFDFYKDSILQKHPLKKRIKIPLYVLDFYSGLTSENTIRSNNKGKVIEFIYDFKLLDFDDFCVEIKFSSQLKKHFKIKTSNYRKYPYLSMSLPFKTNDGATQFHITIYEHHSDQKDIEYNLIFDENWNVLNWKRSIIKTYKIY